MNNIENDLIPRLTIRRIDNAKLITDIVIIKLRVKQNKNFTKLDKQFVLGYASAIMSLKHKQIFS